ncbi:MAG TPA: hypothetical protein VEC99_11905 [Clostridia bacterium]|nr:hypothetical protein [Clostridia bacterium]
MPDDIVEIKPEVSILPGVKLNIRALLRRLTRQAEADPIAAVAHRFLHLFQEHGVPIGQIPRLVPQLTLDKLRTTESLLPALTGDVLDLTANLFGVQRSWIEGASDCIYDCLWCYKRPEQFFEDLASSQIRGVFYPIRALFCTKTLDRTDSREQPIALILMEKVADLADEKVFRYRIYCDEWDWGYWKCRIQLKAMARLVDKELSNRIPLYRTDRKTLKEICSGKRVPPTSALRRPTNDLSLEDFALGPEDTKCSKEIEELPIVLEYIKNNALDKIARRELRKLRG